MNFTKFDIYVFGLADLTFLRLSILFSLCDRYCLFLRFFLLGFEAVLTFSIIFHFHFYFNVKICNSTVTENSVEMHT
jgi:hypothetical protein